MSASDCEVDSAIVEAAEVRRVSERAMIPKVRPRTPAPTKVSADNPVGDDVGSDDDDNDDSPNTTTTDTPAPLSDSDDSSRTTSRLGRRGGPELGKPRYMTLQVLQTWFPDATTWLFCFQPRPGAEIQARLVRKAETTTKGGGYCLKCLPHKETQRRGEHACRGNCCYAPTPFIRAHLEQRSTVGSWRRSIRVRRPGVERDGMSFERLPLVDDLINLRAPAAPADVSSDSDDDATHAMSRSTSVVPTGAETTGRGGVGRKRTLFESSRSDMSAEVGSDDTTDDDGDNASSFAAKRRRMTVKRNMPPTRFADPPSADVVEAIPDVVALQQYVVVAMMVSPASMFVEIERRSTELFKDDDHKHMARDAINQLVQFQAWITTNASHMLNLLPSMVALGHVLPPNLDEFSRWMEHYRDWLKKGRDIRFNGWPCSVTQLSEYTANVKTLQYRSIQDTLEEIACDLNRALRSRPPRPISWCAGTGGDPL